MRRAKRFPATALLRVVGRWQGGRAAMLCVAVLIFQPAGAAAAEFSHYPGAWYDGAQTRAQGAFRQESGVTNLSIYATSDRMDRVDAFYRQFLHPVPSTVAGRSFFCLDPVSEGCKRIVELHDLSPGAGVGTRIIVIDRR